jgi:hypothetical protein
MLYMEIIAVCFQIHSQHTNPLCGQKVEFVSVKAGDTYSLVRLRLQKVKPLELIQRNSVCVAVFKPAV